MDGDWYATESDRASFAIMPRRRDADCATLEDIDTQDAEVAFYRSTYATRATTSLLTILRQIARMLRVEVCYGVSKQFAVVGRSPGIDISLCLSDQLIKRSIRHIPSLCYVPR